MKGLISFLCIFLSAVAPLRGASDTFIDYQNYNHGYCPDCNCYPCRCGDNSNGNAPLVPAAVPGNPPVPAPACKPPDACNPAPVCATNCGISLWWVGLIVAGTAAAAAVIVSSHNGSTPRA